ncbi:MAG: type II toxin-antitoxin system HicB family antitoxin [Desulfobacterales bacterium]|nr:type II toxin-antitoxin system HicB family antitoxin [Desulfobacterales bacterium]
MEYKGYFAKVEFDDEANIFHGEVINLRDVITFEGGTVDELRKAFHDSVDDYLEFCAERGEDPDKPYSGKFVVRVEPELHKCIAIEARRKGASINSLVSEALTKALEETTQDPL